MKVLHLGQKFWAPACPSCVITGPPAKRHDAGKFGQHLDLLTRLGFLSIGLSQLQAVIA